MELNEVRAKYLAFFKERGHAEIPSSSLVPENDPTTLFTGSGMQPLVPYLLGKNHPAGSRLVDSQKSFRSMDIEEVGDNRHTTFFEMLGNWSLGDYFKQEQLPWFFEFLTSVVGLDPERLYVTAFIGDEKNNVPRDTESAEIWTTLFKEKGIDAKVVEIGSEANGYVVGMQGGRIFYYDAKKNWWSRAGTPDNMPAGEPGGPDSEVFYDFGTPHDPAFGAECHPNCDCGRFLEIGNSVFMQYIKQEDGSFALLPKQNVDFGGGLERITAVSQNTDDVFVVAHKNIIEHLEQSSSKKYEDAKKSFRIIADHVKAAVFLISDGVRPGNSDQGYFVRRLIRRACACDRTRSHRVQSASVDLRARACGSSRRRSCDHGEQLYEATLDSRVRHRGRQSERVAQRLADRYAGRIDRHAPQAPSARALPRAAHGAEGRAVFPQGGPRSRA
jgi:alanyl-tRNA synthetase